MRNLATHRDVAQHQALRGQQSRQLRLLHLPTFARFRVSLGRIRVRASGATPTISTCTVCATGCVCGLHAEPASCIQKAAWALAAGFGVDIDARSHLPLAVAHLCLFCLYAHISLCLRRNAVAMLANIVPWVACATARPHPAVSHLLPCCLLTPLLSP